MKKITKGFEGGGSNAKNAVSSSSQNGTHIIYYYIGKHIIINYIFARDYISNRDIGILIFGSGVQTVIVAFRYFRMYSIIVYIIICVCSCMYTHTCGTQRIRRGRLFLHDAHNNNTIHNIKLYVYT